MALADLLFRGLDALIEPKTRERASHEELRALRMVAGLCGALLPLPLLIAGGLVSIAGVPAALICIALFFTLAAVLVRLRVTGGRRHSGTLLWVTLLAVSLFSAMHELALFAYAGPALALIVMLAMYLEGPTEGVVAGLIAAGFMPVLLWMHDSRHVLPAYPVGELRTSLTLLSAAAGLFAVTAFAWVTHTSRERALKELAQALAHVRESDEARERAERELQLSQKLEAVGRLAAGIAHEINTPVQFVGDSVRFLHDGCLDRQPVFDAYERLEKAAAATGLLTTELDDLARMKEGADWDYLHAEFPAALARAADGTMRVAQIVRSMKDFSHPHGQRRSWVDLNRAVQTTLVVARSEYKDVADVKTELSDLPRVEGMPGELNQVILNLLVNAAHAIGEKNRGTTRRGAIIVKTRLDGESLCLSISDDGGGIPLHVQPHIFEPFFTTKEVGRGTGQGLAIAHNVIVNQHHGTLTFESSPGVGTTFTIRLPLKGPIDNKAGSSTERENRQPAPVS
jgi:signal transduction histidine kinase